MLSQLYIDFLDDLTPCQKHQERAKELSASGPNPWNFIPRCREDGGYYEVQCHVGTGQCWCVDENGNKRWDTTVRGLPDCSGRKNNILYENVCVICWAPLSIENTHIRELAFCPLLYTQIRPVPISVKNRYKRALFCIDIDLQRRGSLGVGTL